MTCHFIHLSQPDVMPVDPVPLPTLSRVRSRCPIRHQMKNRLKCRIKPEICEDTRLLTVSLLTTR
jgi:hypothetical protein